MYPPPLYLGPSPSLLLPKFLRYSHALPSANSFVYKRHIVNLKKKLFILPFCYENTSKKNERMTK